MQMCMRWGVVILTIGLGGNTRSVASAWAVTAIFSVCAARAAVDKILLAKFFGDGIIFYKGNKSGELTILLNQFFIYK